MVWLTLLVPAIIAGIIVAYYPNTSPYILMLSFAAGAYPILKGLSWGMKISSTIIVILMLSIIIF